MISFISTCINRNPYNISMLFQKRDLLKTVWKLYCYGPTMNFLFVLVLAVSIVETLQESRPGCYFPCPQVYQPVCGSDGKTYGNTCKLSLAACQSGIAGSIRKSYDGPCGTRKIRRKRIDICVLPPAAGLCLAYFPRWHYNPRSGRCLQFIYGGCQGNENNFETKKACKRRCSRKKRYTVHG